MQNICLIKILIILLVSNHAFSQSKRGNNWILGSNHPDFLQGILIDFKSGAVEVGYIEKNLHMGTSTNLSISDAEGNLLLYSNGCTISDARNEMVPGSEMMTMGLEGWTDCSRGNLSIESAVFLPAPCDDNLIYYIGLDLEIGSSYFANNLFASVISLSLNGGFGEVTQRDLPIIQDTLAAGNVNATRHANGRDWWICVLRSKADGSNCYYSILLNESGFQEPIKSCTGIPWKEVTGEFENPGSDVGSACFSPNGQIYTRFTYQNGLHVYDFNNSTGTLEAREVIYFPNDSFPVHSGLSISPNNRYLYASTGEKLYQFDLWASSIADSGEVVAIWDGAQDPQATIFQRSKLAPDNKIYISSVLSTRSLHVINEPNKKGLECDVEQRGLQFPENPLGQRVLNGAAIPNIPYFGPEPDNSPCDSLLMLDHVHEQDLEFLILTLFPNPVQESLTVELSLPYEISAVTISAIAGEKKFEKYYNGEYMDMLNLDISTLSGGIYFLTLHTDMGPVTRKFIRI